MSQTKTLIAYSGKQEVKDFYINQLREDIRLGYLQHGGATFRDARGKIQACWVGCVVRGYDHAKFEREPIQFPEWLARLCDTLHENTSASMRQKFDIAILEIIPVGFAEWEQVKCQFLSAILQENIDRVQVLPISDKLKAEVLSAIKQCKDYVESPEKTRAAAEAAAESAAEAAWSAESAESAAESAWSAESAARAARAAESAEAAEAAAWSAESAEAAARAAEAAWSAESAAEAAARAARAAFDRYAELLISLFEKAGSASTN